MEYLATIKDVTEPQIRLFLRSKSFALQRVRAPLIIAFIAPATVYVMSLIRANSSPWWVYLIAFTIGYAWTNFTVKSSVIKQIRKAAQHATRRDLGHKMPSQTVYVVEDDKLKCSSLGVQISFDLDSLSDVNEDSEHLELVFGDIGLCTIPLRVFDDAGHKSAFLKSLKT